jgi:hypothetical protein
MPEPPLGPPLGEQRQEVATSALCERGSGGYQAGSARTLLM